MDINISKLHRNSNILLETEDTVFEIMVNGPKTGTVTVSGGPVFLKPIKAKIQGSSIKKGRPIAFYYKSGDGAKKLKTKNVISATIYSPDNSWHYDAIEKDDENSN